VSAVRDSGQSCDSDFSEQLEVSAAGYLEHGALYWPGADLFLLVETDRDGNCTGEAAVICPTCVREAARLVLARLHSACPTLLDLVGQGQAQPERCSICGGGPEG
jgi:hypothetical protein